jgi:hypothetical protein
MRYLTISMSMLSLCSFALKAAEPSPVASGERVERVAEQTLIHPYPVDVKFLNDVTQDEEQGFQNRINHALTTYKDAFGGGKYGNAYFENEKQSYPNAFIDFINGNREPALKFLQSDDIDGWNSHTLMVDWYPCFTIRSQTRKYFFLGQYLDPAYRQKMFESARIWTEQDPLRRPHAAFVPPNQREAKGMPKDGGWTPLYFNSWVDVRSTDNLRAMREGAVFLMAEETGNAEVAAIYKERIRAYATACFNTGMGEWDSANYLSHTMVGYLQIYDFAKDPEVKALAKGVLDYLSTVAAVAYFKGGVAAPNARDYNNVGPMEGFAGEVYYWFGDTDFHEEGRPYREFVQFATSAYRPPSAVLAVARKDFPRPVEIIESKPTYEGWFKKEGGEDTVEYPEFLHVGNTFQLGTLPFLHRGDVCGFRLGMAEAKRGLATLIAFSGTKGYKGHATATNGQDQVAQLRNAVLWMNREPTADLHLSVPAAAEITQQEGWTFVHGEQTWIALRGIHADGGNPDQAAVEKLFMNKGKSRYPEDTILTWTGSGNGPCGLYLEVGEQQSHGSFADFTKAICAKAKIDDAALGADGRVVATTALGATLALTITDGLPIIERNGKAYDWATHTELYGTGSVGTSPVTLGWKTDNTRGVTSDASCLALPGACFAPVVYACSRAAAATGCSRGAGWRSDHNGSDDAAGLCRNVSDRIDLRGQGYQEAIAHLG